MWNTGYLGWDEGTSAENAYIQEINVKEESLVGLISVSDYAYAGGSECTAIEYDSCGSSNWLLLKNKYYWTIIPDAIDEYYYWYIHADGFANSDSADTDDPNSVRPSVYLSSDVQIVGGTGEITVSETTGPYILK